MTKERFCGKPDLSALYKTLEARKILASTNGVPTIAIPKLGCGLNQLKWQEFVELLRDIFKYADVQIVVYTREENGVHAMSADGDAEFYADDEVERYKEEFFVDNCELETDFTMDSKSFQSTCDDQFPFDREENHNNRHTDNYLQYQPKELTNYAKEFDFQHSDFTDEELIILIHMLVDARDVNFQQKFHENHTLLQEVDLKATHGKTFVSQRKLNFLVMLHLQKKSIAIRVKNLKKLKSPESKRDVN